MKARDNPFRTDRVLTVRYQFVHDDWQQLLRRFAAWNGRGAIVGPEGAGKTTLIEDLEQRLRQMGYGTRRRRLWKDRPIADQLREALDGLSAHDILLLDGAELIGRWRWSNFCRHSRHAAGLVVTAHRSGLLPTLQHCRTNVQLLQRIVRELAGPAADAWRPLVAQLFEQHRGNLRGALRELYDRCAEGKLSPRPDFRYAAHGHSL